MKSIDLVYLTNIEDTLGIGVRLEIIRYLAKKYNVFVYTNQPALLKSEVGNCEVVTVKIKKNEYPYIGRFILLYKLSKTLNGNNREVVFLFHDTSFLNFFLKKAVAMYTIQYGFRAKKHRNVKSKVLYKINKYIELQGIKKAQINFVVSKPIQDYFISKGIKNTEFIYHAVDIEKFKFPSIDYEQHYMLKQRKRDGDFIVTYTGWFTENRGFNIILGSIKDVVKRNTSIVLVLAGANQEYSKKIDDFIKKNNLDYHIINFGIVNSSVIPGILYYSDICLSFLEDIQAYRLSPPQKIIEYFAAGKPVICNKIQTHEYIVKHGENGIIINYEQDELTESILKLSEDSELLSKMSNAAQIDGEKHSTSIIYKKITKRINSLTQQSS